MVRKALQVLGCLGIILAVISCKGKPQIKVGVTVEFDPAALEDNSLFNVTYHWKVDSGFKPIDRDLVAYVHFVDKNNKILFQDDHRPELPTSQWKEGLEPSYKHLLLVPPVTRTSTDQEDMPVKIVVGLYDPKDPQGPNYAVVEQETRLKYNAKGPEKIQIRDQDGWFPEEWNPQQTLRWRWTGQQAFVMVRNPKKNAILYVRGLVNKDAIADQKVKLEIANSVIEEFVPKDAEFTRYYQIPADQLGAEDLIPIRFSVDKTFVPAKIVKGSGDQRELGMQIFTIYFK